MAASTRATCRTCSSPGSACPPSSGRVDSTQSMRPVPTSAGSSTSRTWTTRSRPTRPGNRGSRAAPTTATRESVSRTGSTSRSRIRAGPWTSSPRISSPSRPDPAHSATGRPRLGEAGATTAALPRRAGRTPTQTSELAEAHGFDVIYIEGNMMSMTYRGVPRALAQGFSADVQLSTTAAGCSASRASGARTRKRCPSVVGR